MRAPNGYSADISGRAERRIAAGSERSAETHGGTRRHVRNGHAKFAGPAWLAALRALDCQLAAPWSPRAFR